MNIKMIVMFVLFTIVYLIGLVTKEYISGIFYFVYAIAVFIGYNFLNEK